MVRFTTKKLIKNHFLKIYVWFSPTSKNLLTKLQRRDNLSKVLLLGAIEFHDHSKDLLFFQQNVSNWFGKAQSVIENQEGFIDGFFLVR